MCSLCCISASQPKLEVVGGVKMDLGSVFSGLKVTRPLFVWNSGSEALTISKVDVECGCTQVSVSSRHLSPGDTAVLKVTFDSKTYLGKTEKGFYILSNDPGAPKEEITFTVNAINVLESNPMFLVFYNVKVDSPATTSIKLKNTSHNRIKVSKIVSNDPRLTVRLSKKILGQGKEADLTGTFVPDQVGQFEGEFELITDSREQSRVPIRYIAVVVKK
jgi:hypothetical protein